MSWEKIEEHLFDKYCVESIDKQFTNLQIDHDNEIYNKALSDLWELAISNYDEDLSLGELAEIIDELKMRRERMTNADKIRAMSDEELTEFIETKTSCECCEYEHRDRNCYNQTCEKGILEWLQSEAK